MGNYVSTGSGSCFGQQCIFQDNMSAMKLERNGLHSCGQKSQHINVQHFWIMDRIRSDDIDLRHCPTEDMLADYFTKPLQGATF